MDYLQQQIDLFSKKIQAKIGQDSSFNAVTRGDKNITRKYLGEQLTTQGPIYNPDYAKIWKQSFSNVKMTTNVTNPRPRIPLLPQCMKDGADEPCSYERRRNT